MKALACGLLWILSAGALAAPPVRIPEASAGYRLRVEHCSAEYFVGPAKPLMTPSHLA